MTDYGVRNRVKGRSRDSYHSHSVVAAALAFAGAALGAKPRAARAQGRGGFFPNPVATLQNQTLTDQKDADYPALQPAYRSVTLTNLDGSGYLAATGRTSSGRPATAAYSPTNSSSTAAATTGSSR